MIEVKDLVKEFGGKRAVDGISFVVPKGQILGFLGPNGAGKSTTMKMLTGFLEPSAGTAVVGGYDIGGDSIEVRRLIGYLPESAPLYEEMTVGEFLCFMAEMRGLDPQEIPAAAAKMKDVCFLGGVWHQTIDTLSKGYRQRVAFAQALIHDPPVLILDEPTDGLDPNQKHEVRELIRRMGQAKTIILSTHILEEVEAVCERVIIIARGQLIADASPEKLLETAAIHNAVTLRFKGEIPERGAAVLGELAGVAEVETLAGTASLRCFAEAGQSIIDQVAEKILDEGWPVLQIQQEQARLDQVFRQLTLA